MRVLLETAVYDPCIRDVVRMQREVFEHLNANEHPTEVLTYGVEPEHDRAQPYRIHRIAPRRIAGGSSAAMLLQLIRLSRRYDLILCGFASPTSILAQTAQ